jgi:hypothetical protein
MRNGGITGFEVKIGRDGGIYEPGTGPSVDSLADVLVALTFAN